MKILKFTFSIFILTALAATAVFAQDQTRNCGTMEYLEWQQQEDPKQEKRMERIEHFTQRFSRVQARVNGVITIPVVVHIVYNNSTENISDAQVQSQINILNQDFRRTNNDADGVWSQAADSEIQFCLASRDPNGNPTNGITRTFTTRSSFSSNNFVKFDANGGKGAWPAGDYLNIWVCDLGGGLLGYAQFPGGNASTDGVVCDYAYFGNIGTATAPFDLGRTATHEVGHYLNLRHIWGDGGCSVDDFVSDTPTSDASNTGCAIGHVSCGSTDMVQNYMDYSDDACMNLFTQGQKTRMRALFESGGFRESLLNSTACDPPADPTCSDGIQNQGETGIDCGGPCPAACPTCTDGIQNGDETGVDCGGSNCPPCPCLDNEVNLTITLDNYPEETSWTLKNASGTTIASSGGTYANQADGSTVVESFCLPDGCYDFTINDAYGDGICCGYGNGSYSLTDTGGNVLASGGSFGSSETQNFCVGGGSGPTCSDGIQNGNETGVDCGGPDCDPCTPAPTCSDGIQNGNETGVDCGGPDCDPCGGGGSNLILGSYFETGLDGWIDGGGDCYRYFGSFSYEGDYSIRLRDNSGTRSAMTSPSFDAGGYDQLEIKFYFYPNSMEFGEDFWVRYNGGSGWSTVASYSRGTDFDNGSFYSATITLNSSDFNFPSNARFRIQCDASANSDQVYIDQVTITGLSGSRWSEGELVPTIELIDGKAPVVNHQAFDIQDQEEMEVSLYPNPAKDQLFLNIPASMTIATLKVYDLNGRMLQMHQVEDRIDRFSIEELKSGFYYLSIETPDGVINKKFVKH